MTIRAKSIAEEFSHELTIEFTGRPSWSESADGLLLTVWRQPFPAVPKASEFGYLDQFTQRSVFFTVKTADDRRIAAVRFDHWRSNWREGADDYLFNLGSFFECADNYSRAAWRLATVVNRHWAIDWRGDDDDLHREDWMAAGQPFQYGSVVEFHRLRIEGATAAQSQTIWVLIRILIKREFETGRNRAALILLKAFPLEYESAITAANRANFEHRQLAMARLYEQRLGFKRLPAKRVDDIGWMYRRLHGPEPGDAAREWRNERRSRKKEVRAKQ